MRHLKWIVLGALLGFFGGKVLFRSSAPAAAPTASAYVKSILNPSASDVEVLTLPKIEDFTLAEAHLRLSDLAFSGSQEDAAFSLGMIQLAGHVSDMKAMAHFFNNVQDPRELRDLAESVFEQLAQRDPLGALEAANYLKNESFQRLAQRVIMKSWAGEDPEAALAYIGKLPSDESTDTSWIYYAAFDGIAKHDPRNAMLHVDRLQLEDRQIDQLVTDYWINQNSEEAIAWIKALEESPRQIRLLEEAADSLAVKQPSKALAIALSIPTTKSAPFLPAQELLYDLAALPFPGSADKAAGLLSELPLELQTEEFASRLATHAILGSPDRGIEIAEELPEALRQGYWKGVVTQIGWKDPVKATEFLGNLEEGPLLAEAYETIMRAWTKTDEFEAAKWLAELPPSDSKDKAVRMFSDQLISIDPERAVQWASSINDPNRRRKHVENLLSKWRAADPHAVEQWEARR